MAWAAPTAYLLQLTPGANTVSGLVTCLYGAVGWCYWLPSRGVTECGIMPLGVEKAIGPGMARPRPFQQCPFHHRNAAGECPFSYDWLPSFAVLSLNRVAHCRRAGVICQLAFLGRGRFVKESLLTIPWFLCIMQAARKLIECRVFFVFFRTSIVFSLIIKLYRITVDLR